MVEAVSTRGRRVLTPRYPDPPGGRKQPRARASGAGLRPGSAPSSRGVGPSAPSRHHAVAAIIAALSVQSAGRREERPPPGGPRRRAPAPQAGVRGHAAAEHERPGTVSSAAATSFVDQHVDDRLLERRGDVGDRCVGLAAHGGAPPRSSGPRTRSRAVAAASGAGTRSLRRRPSRARRSIAGPARIAEAEEARDLVERLAGGVVDGLAEDAVAAVALDHDEHRVTARHEQHRERRLEVRLLQPGGVAGAPRGGSPPRRAGRPRAQTPSPR